MPTQDDFSGRRDSFAGKSSPGEIRARFDADVERFSNLETGQTATMDAALCLELVARAAATATPDARHVLDVGCGAGNFTLRLRQQLDFERVTLVDLSPPMLQRATERLAAAGLRCEAIQADMRDALLRPESFDIALAGATLHHLRGVEEWEAMFRKLVDALAPGGSLWIFDMVSHEHEGVERLQRERYAAYLREVGGEEFARKVFSYIEVEDTPRPLTFQLELLRRCGLRQIDVLHKNACFAAFGGKKSR